MHDNDNNTVYIYSNTCTPAYMFAMHMHAWQTPNIIFMQKEKILWLPELKLH